MPTYPTVPSFPVPSSSATASSAAESPGAASGTSASPPLPDLAALEARVLGVLIEKEHTVPDTYPLSLNALAAGCNQKSSRDPVMNATEAEVAAALDRLRGLSLVVESSGGRVMRYAHNAGRVLQVPSAAVALLATLALRGPQTAGEIRINSERLHRFADISAVEAYLHELAARPAGALVAELARQPGSRENRWMHLLCGAPAATASAGQGARERAWEQAHPLGLDAPTAGPDARGPGLDARVAALEARIGELEGEVATLRAELERLAASRA